MNRYLSALVAIAITGVTVAGSTGKITSIDTALAMAKSQNKLLFLEFGREKCENCQALRQMISKNEVKLPPAKFIYADVNCDDPATMRTFSRKFDVRGAELPFVVVVSPEGKQLAARSGSGTAADFSKLLQDAEHARK